MKISFNEPYFDEAEANYVSEALKSGNHSGNKEFSKKVKSFISKRYNNSKVFLTPSCSAALEMGIMLSGIEPGDEVIMPSYTFSSTANAVLVFGGVPKFCEVLPGTMNLDPNSVEALITERTRMIIPIDYAGVPCKQEEINQIAKKYNLVVMLDAAQSFGSKYNGLPTGINSDLICFSFHETKNLSCGEGGALIVNRKDWEEKASFIQEKGTDRLKMLAGLQDKYSWISNGSSYIMADILAAILVSQIEKEDEIRSKRKIIFDSYIKLFQESLSSTNFQIIELNEKTASNYHSFWFLLSSSEERQKFMDLMEGRGIPAYIGYVPLHSSKMGLKLNNELQDLPVTNDLASRIVRLPIYPSLTSDELKYILENIKEVIREIYK